MKKMAGEEDVEEVYARWKREVLEELRPVLVDNIQPDKLYTYLRSKRVLNEDDVEDIEAERTRKKKVERFLDHISKRGSDGFDQFCEAIRRNKTQLFLVRKVMDKFESKRANLDAEHNHPNEQGHQAVENTFNPPRPGEPGGPMLPDSVLASRNVITESELFVQAHGPTSESPRPRSPPPPYSI